MHFAVNAAKFNRWAATRAEIACQRVDGHSLPYSVPFRRSSAATVAASKRLLALEPRDGVIVATSLRSHDEVRDIKALRPKTKPRVSADMVAIASKIMKQKSAHFDPKKFDDRYENALRALIRRKQKGHNVVEDVAKEPEDDNVVDLMEALRSSLKGGASRRKPSARAQSRAKTATKRKTPAKRKNAPAKRRRAS